MTPLNKPTREIKFRAWERLTELMVTGLIDLGYYNNELAYLPYPEDSVLMQYTGLKDRNGVEIYESDLLEIEKAVGEVYWREESGQWWLKGEWGSNALHNFLSYGEVVGNKYE